MGANAQTTVPTFTAAQVLTADQMNQSARTGVPVFADTTARDAGFGGSGEKVLAEGQLCYVENLTGVAQIQYYDGANWVSLGSGALALISATTIGSAVSSVTVSSAFNSTYDNYLISISGGVASTSVDLALQLGATTTGYYTGYSRVTYSTGAASAASNNNAANFSAVGVGTTDSLFMNVNVMAPNLAKFTNISGGFGVTLTGSTSTLFGGFLNNTTQYTAFTIIPSSGTLTGGTIRVYGYANS
jgi:hypothetical protein